MQNTFNFNKLLYKELNKKSTNNTNNICLISNEKLSSTHIKLECGHLFNYKAIFKEIKKQKLNHNHLETHRLKKTQIKCPYCRNIQNGILPHIQNYEKVHYVNWPEKLAYKAFKCGYIFLSGKKKSEVCSKPCSKKYCLQHKKILDRRNEKMLKKQKEKKEKKDKKEEAAKEVAKEAAKEAEKNTIIKHLINNTENEIISHINNLTSDSFFMKCKQDFSNNSKNIPKLHVTKNISYFRCQCQHLIINKNNKVQQCKKYMICSNKIKNKSEKNSITPKFYKKYLCTTHNYKDDTDKQSNLIIFPNNIHIDTLNTPNKFLLNCKTFNKYLSKYYSKYFHSHVYDYKQFQEFKKTTILMEDHYVNFLVSVANP